MTYDEDVALLEERLTLADSAEERIELMSRLAWDYCRRSLDDSTVMLDSLRELLDTHSHPSALYHVKTITARHHYTRGKLAEALLLIDEPIAHYRAVDEPEWLCWALSVQGIVLRNLGEYERSFAVEREHYHVAHQHNDTEEISIALNAMGVCAQYTYQYEKALEYFQQAYALAVTINDPYTQALMLNNKAGMLAQLERYDEAIEGSTQALMLLKEHNYTIDQTRPLGRLGDTYMLQGDYENAARCYEQRVSLLQDTERRSQYHTARVNLATAYVRMGKASAAIPLLHEALEAFTEINSKRGLFMTHEYLAYAYEKLEQFHLAYEHFRQFHQIKSEVFSEESDTRLKNMQTLFDVEHMQQEMLKERQRREQDRQQFETLSRMKDHFVNAAAHDLKNPLAGIMMSADLLERHLKNGNRESASRTIEYIRQHSIKIRDLITNMLELAQLETGQYLKRAAVSSDAIMGYVEDYRLRNLQTGQPVLHITPPSQVFTLYVDQAQIERLIDNLLSNAVKFTATDGEIHFRLSCQDDLACLEITDNGIGIAANEIDKIFDHFFRASNAQVHRVSGTGLGLSIVKTIVEQHGGRITVHSEPNRGTTFTLCLPLLA